MATAVPVSADALRFCQSLPKAELHAHLHGSIRNDTLIQLVEASKISGSSAQTVKDVLPSSSRSLHDCFRIFDLIHMVVQDVATVERITREYIEDCHKDKIIYTELRTTPRPVAAADSEQYADLLRIFDVVDDELDKDALVYIAAVICTFARCQRSGEFNVLPRLLLSINRTASLEKAERTVNVAAFLSNRVVVFDGDTPKIKQQSETIDSDTFYGPYIVGIDVSGDPTRGSFKTFLPALRLARESGLKITVHAGETMNVAEVIDVLDFRPDRLGHMCVLPPTIVTQLIDSKAIPIEVCPSSNALTLHLPTLHHHPTISPWLTNNYPFAICTDDQGVFNITLSEEYVDVMETYSLDEKQVIEYAKRSFNFAFDTSKEFSRLLETVKW